MLQAHFRREADHSTLPRGDALSGVCHHPHQPAAALLIGRRAHSPRCEPPASLKPGHDSTIAGTGSGFVWDRNGHIVTNFHVVEGGTHVRVTLADQSSCDAKVVGVDAARDIAVLSK